MTEWPKNNQLQALSWRTDNCVWDIKSQFLCFRLWEHLCPLHPFSSYPPPILLPPHLICTPHHTCQPCCDIYQQDISDWIILAATFVLQVVWRLFSPLGMDRKGGQSRMNFFDHVVDSDMKLSALLYLMKALIMCHLSFSPHTPLPYGSCSPVSVAGRGSRGSWWSCQALCIAVRPAALSDRPPWCLEQRQSGQTSSLYSAGSGTTGHLGVCKECYMWHSYSDKILLKHKQNRRVEV